MQDRSVRSTRLMPCHQNLLPAESRMKIQVLALRIFIDLPKRLLTMHASYLRCSTFKLEGLASFAGVHQDFYVSGPTS